MNLKQNLVIPAKAGMTEKDAGITVCGLSFVRNLSRSQNPKIPSGINKVTTTKTKPTMALPRMGLLPAVKK
jgi:hypothetical protein